MSNSYKLLKQEFATQLQDIELLAPIPVIIEDFTDIQTMIDGALAGQGVKDGASGKVGLCFVISLVRGNERDKTVESAEDTVVHVELVINRELNNSDIGHQLDPEDVFFAARKQISTWDRGYGKKTPHFIGWDSAVSAKETMLWMEFSVPQLLNFTNA